MFAIETQQPHRIVLYETLDSAQQALVQTALQWACKEVGDKNVHNELNSNRASADFPDGLCLHYQETPGERTILATQKRTVPGWVTTATEYMQLNQFTLLPAEFAARPERVQLPPTVLQQRGGLMSYEAVLEELRATLLRRRKRIR